MSEEQQVKASAIIVAPANLKIVIRSTLLGVVVEVVNYAPTAGDPLCQRRREHPFANITDAIRALPELCTNHIYEVSPK